MSEQDSNTPSVEQAVEALSKHVEQIGMDVARESLGAVFEHLLVVARTHPEQAERNRFGALVLNLWNAAAQGRLVLDEFSSEQGDALH